MNTQQPQPATFVCHCGWDNVFRVLMTATHLLASCENCGNLYEFTPLESQQPDNSKLPAIPVSETHLLPASFRLVSQG